MPDPTQHDMIEGLLLFGWGNNDLPSCLAAHDAARDDPSYRPNSFCSLVLSYFGAHRFFADQGRSVRWAPEVGGPMWRWLLTGYGEIDADQLLRLAGEHGYSSPWRAVSAHV